MAQTSITFHIDPSKKTQFEGICSDAGIDITTAFQALVNISVRNNRLPFELKIPNVITVETLKDAESSTNLVGPFESLSELMEALNAEDCIHSEVQEGLSSCPKERV